MYFSASFYRVLQRAYFITFDEDVLRIVMNEGDNERRVPYSEMNAEDARAALHYIGMRLRRMQEEFRKL